MVTQFITVEISLSNLTLSLQDTIEAQLTLQGEPLRWAITAVHEGIAHIEAVVLQEI
jgi:hypothetical protein